MNKPFPIPKQSRIANSQEDIFSDPMSLDINLDISEISAEGKPGYSAAKSLILGMINSGYEDLDIMIKLGEEFDRDLAERVLADCRRKGII